MKPALLALGLLAGGAAATLAAVIPPPPHPARLTDESRTMVASDEKGWTCVYSDGRTEVTVYLIERCPRAVGVRKAPK
jgi:hypothetical protein